MITKMRGLVGIPLRLLLLLLQALIPRGFVCTRTTSLAQPLILARRRRLPLSPALQAIGDAARVLPNPTQVR